MKQATADRIKNDTKQARTRKPTSELTAVLVAALLAGCGSSGSSDPVLSDEASDPLAPGGEQIVEVPSNTSGDDVSSETSTDSSSEQGTPDSEANIPEEPSSSEEESSEESVDTPIAEDDVAEEVTEEVVEEAPVEEEEVVELESEPPTPPGEVLSIEYSGYDTEIFWTRSTDDGWVLGYDIFRNDELLSPMLDALSFYDDTVQPETEYTYTVIAVDDHGIRSDPTSVTLTTPADLPSEEFTANIAVLRGGDSAAWEISDGLGTDNGMPSGGYCIYQNGAGSGIGITEAWLPGNGDAFDLGSMMWVNGEQLGGYLRSATNSTSNYATFPIAGLIATTEFHAISTQPVIRHYTSFSNETADDISVIVNFVSNFGSDGSTTIVGSSSNDLEFDSSDRWVITDDYEDGGDPTNTTVFFGPDSPVSNSVFVTESVFQCAGNEGLNARIDLTIPAGESRALMFFHAMHYTSALSIDAAAQFDTTPAIGSDLVEGLTESQLQEVANWVY